MDRYLLFIEVQDFPADHDIQVTDFVKSFPTLEEATDFYIQSKYSQKGVGEEGWAHPALVAKWDGENLTELFRVKEDNAGVTRFFQVGWDDK